MTLATRPEPALDRKIDETIALIPTAQKPDGYLDAWYEANRPGQEFTNLRDDADASCWNGPGGKASGSIWTCRRRWSDLRRGPLVYCLEGIVLPPDTALRPTFRPALLGGVVTLDDAEPESSGEQPARRGVGLVPLEAAVRAAGVRGTDSTTRSGRVPPARRLVCRAARRGEGPVDGGSLPGDLDDGRCGSRRAGRRASMGGAWSKSKSVVKAQSSRF